MDTLSLVALTLGAGWASGINLYAAILTLGLMGATGMVALPPGLHVLTHPLVLGVAGLMYMVEFVADKTPGVDTAWDGIHTFIRIPAGILLAYGATQELDPAVQFAAMLVAGGLATASHATKAGSRVLINTSPEPVSNWTASLTEDVAVIGGLWTALHYPLAFLIFLTCFILVLLWALPKIWRGVRMLMRRISRYFGMRDKDEAPSSPVLQLEHSPDKESSADPSA